MPALSIIVPVYNTSEGLESCLDSLLAQRFRDFELILVNDGSTDRSPEICRRYHDREPDRIVFLSGPNRGVGAARNRGLGAARGEWVAFCDSDDRVDPELYDFLSRRAVEEEADLSCCALRQISEDGKTVKRNFPFADGAVVRGEEEIRDRCFLPLLLSRPGYHGFLPICLLRRELVEAANIRFVEGLNILEDVLFLLEYLLYVRCLTVSDRPLYDYLRNGESLCGRYFSERYLLERERAWIMLEKQRLEIFNDSGLTGTRPDLAAEFRMRIGYHEAQAVCCDGALRGGARRRALREIARRMRHELTIGMVSGVSARMFLFTLFYFRPLLPALCRLKRMRDGIGKDGR